MDGKLGPLTDKHVTIRLMLEEFQFGRALLREYEANPDLPSGHVGIRFLRNALVDSIVTKFLSYGEGWLERELDGLDWKLERSAVRAVLASPIGKTTLAKTLQRSRNKLLAHGERLDVAALIIEHEEESGLAHEEIAAVVPELLDELFDRVEDLARGMDRIAKQAVDANATTGVRPVDPAAGP
jgi:hypothetical protein